MLLILVDYLSVYTGQRHQTGQVAYDIFGGLAAGLRHYFYGRGR
jgi:hypothetical protein